MSGILYFIAGLCFIGIFALMAHMVKIENENLELKRKLDIVQQNLNYIFEIYGRPEE